MVYGNSVLLSYNQTLIDNINISPDQINKFIESFNDNGEILTEAQIKKNSEEQFNKFKKFIDKSGNPKISQKIHNNILKTSNEVVDVIKSEGINKTVFDKISAKFQTFVDDMVDSLEFDNIDGLDFEKYDANKIKNAFILTTIAGSINTMVAIIVSAFTLGNTTAINIATSCISAPIVEELCKQISIKGGYIKEFTVVFNMLEATQYIVVMTINGVNPVKALKVRLCAVGLHLVTIFVQWFTSNEKIQKAFGIINKNDKEKSSTIGYILGVIIHSIWNSLACFSKTFNSVIDTLLN